MEGIADIIMWGKSLYQLYEKFQITPSSLAWYLTVPLCQHTAVRSVSFIECTNQADLNLLCLFWREQPETHAAV